jgi:hypothetical protein
LERTTKWGTCTITDAACVAAMSEIYPAPNVDAAEWRSGSSGFFPAD